MALQFEGCFAELWLTIRNVNYHSCSQDRGQMDGLSVGALRTSLGGKKNRANETIIKQ